MAKTGTEKTRGLVLGCGAAVGFSWSVGALSVVEETLGWDARTADVIVGTSAGSELAAMLGAGISVADLVAALQGRPYAPELILDHLAAGPGLMPALPSFGLTAPAYARLVRRPGIDGLAAMAGLLPRGGGDATWLRGLGTELSHGQAWVSHPNTWLVAADRLTGERVAFGSPGAPATDVGAAIAASWAVPGLFPPVDIVGRSYIDGGAISPTSADLLAPLALDEVVVVAPMCTAGGAQGRGLSRIERVVRRAMTKRLDAEIDLLEAAGTRVLRVEPTQQDLDVMGFNFTDYRRRGATLESALATTHL